jgi:hypothetical protein
MYGASSCADGGENHLAWRISDNIFEYAAADVRQVVVLALGACYIERTSTWTNAETRHQWQLLVTGLWNWGSCDYLSNCQRLKKSSAWDWLRSYGDGTYTGHWQYLPYCERKTLQKVMFAQLNLREWEGHKAILINISFHLFCIFVKRGH